MKKSRLKEIIREELENTSDGVDEARLSKHRQNIKNRELENSNNRYIESIDKLIESWKEVLKKAQETSNIDLIDSAEEWISYWEKVKPKSREEKSKDWYDNYNKDAEQWKKDNNITEEEEGSIKLKKDTPDQDIKKFTDKGFDVELKDINERSYDDREGEELEKYEKILGLIENENVEAIKYLCKKFNVKTLDDLYDNIADLGEFDVYDLYDSLVFEKFIKEDLKEEDINSPLMMKLRADKTPKPTPKSVDTSKIQDIEKKIKILEKERKKIESELENDPEVIDNSTDGNHPQVAHYGKLLNKIDDKIFELLKKKKELGGETKMTPYINIDEDDKFHVTARNLIQTNKDLQQLAKAYEKAEPGEKGAIEKQIRKKHAIKKELEQFKGQLDEQLNEGRKKFKLDTLSASDTDKICAVLDKDGIKWSTKGSIITIELDRDTPQASILISHLHRISKFDEI